MTTKPKKNDLGRDRDAQLVRSNGNEWWHDDGYGPLSDEKVTPTGERAEPIEWLNDVEAVAAEMRAWAGGVAALRHVADWADRIDPPTPEPPAPEYVRFGDWEPEVEEVGRLQAEIAVTPYADVAAKLTIILDAILAQIIEGKVLRP